MLSLEAAKAFASNLEWAVERQGTRQSGQED